MLVDGWLPRAAAARPEQPALQTPEGSLSPTRAARRARGAGAAELDGARRRARAPASRSRCPPGLAFARALHACLLLGAVAVPIDLRLRRPSASAVTAGCGVVLVEEPLAPTGADRGGRGPAAPPRGHDLDATAAGDAHLRHHRRAEAGRAHLRQPAVERARLGRRARASTATSAGCARCRSRTSAASRSCVRSAIYATTAVVHERFDTDAVLAGAAREEITLVRLVATTLRGCWTRASSARRRSAAR